ncbi:TPA: hypothetical protein ACKP22_000720 [Pseudomonas putida]
MNGFRHVKHTTPFTLLALGLVLSGCSSSSSSYTPKTSNLDWETPGMQLGGDRGLPLRVDDRCRKRGCDNHKLFFNPAEPEPSVNSIHRGW